MAESKKITLHPVDSSGIVDTNTNLYPKTNNFVDENGNKINVATKEDIPTNYVTTDTDQLEIRGLKHFIDAVAFHNVVYLPANLSITRVGEPYSTAIIEWENGLRIGAGGVETNTHARFDNSGVYHGDDGGLFWGSDTGGISLKCNGNIFTFPNKEGTFALTSDLPNIDTQISQDSTDETVPSSKCVYDNLLNINTAARWYKHQTSFSFYYKHKDDPTTTINNGSVSVMLISTYKDPIKKGNPSLLRFAVCQALEKGLSFSTTPAFLDTSAVFISATRFKFNSHLKHLTGEMNSDAGHLPIATDEFNPFNVRVTFDTSSGNGDIYIKIYEPDKIDTTTGEVIRGENIIANDEKVLITWSTTDSVTEIGE